MRTRISILLLFGLLLSAACTKSEIQTYKEEDTAVVFTAHTNQFSLKGMTEDSRDLLIPVRIIGIPSDKDREFKVEIEDSTAVLGADYTIVSNVIEAGSVTGAIRINVKKLPTGTETLITKMKIVPNENFREGPPDESDATVVWSEAYVRPSPGVWQAWHTYFSHGYSREYHKLLYDFFGPEIETYVSRQAQAREDPSFSFKLPSWWYSASRDFRDYVRKHDEANPSDPWRHSDDYESYRSYLIAYGEGEKPEVIPTILETLVIL